MNSKLFTIIILVCFSSSVTAQESIGISEIGNRWNYAKHYLSTGPNGHNYWKNYSFQVTDSIHIGEMKYNKLVQYGDTTFSNVTTKFFIRQSGKEVFYSDSLHEIKVFDFGLEKGDSTVLTTSFDSTSQAHIVRSVLVIADSVIVGEYNGGIRLKTLYVRVHPLKGERFDPDFYINDIWIEGIGSKWIGLRHIEWYQNMLITSGSEDSEYLLCFQNNGNSIYQNPEYNTCYIRTNKRTIHKENEDLLVITSKTNRELTINTFEKGLLTITTPDGQQVFTKRNAQSENTQHLPQSGIYLFRFVSTNGQVQTGKVVVR